MLMTKFSYSCVLDDKGVRTIVTRLSDGAVKEFHTAGHKTTNSMQYFMDSITDDLAEGYFPKERKIKEKK